MLYDISLRRKVLERVKDGMNKCEAARLFKISPNTIYECLKRRDDLTPRYAPTRKRKLDKEALSPIASASPNNTSFFPTFAEGSIVSLKSAAHWFQFLAIVSAVLTRPPKGPFGLPRGGEGRNFRVVS